MTTSTPSRISRIARGARRVFADLDYAAKRIGIPPEEADRLR